MLIWRCKTLHHPVSWVQRLVLLRLIYRIVTCCDSIQENIMVRVSEELKTQLVGLT